MKLTQLAFGAWALCLSGAVFAAGTTVEPTTTTTNSDEHVVVRVIKRDGKGEGPHAGHDMADPDNCADGTRHLDTSNDVDDGKGQKKRTRIILCSKGDHASDDIAARLTEARKRIAGDDSLSAETKAKVLDTLDAEIARVKAAPSK